MTVKDLWDGGSEAEWDVALSQYWERVMPENLELEHVMETLDPHKIEALSTEDFYDFLYDQYYVWKYTAKNRLAMTRAALEHYRTDPGGLSQLAELHEALCHVDCSDVAGALHLAKRLHGLGVAGASGLLALLYPRDFGTVDQFVLEALHQVPELVDQLPPLARKERLTVPDGVVLIELMRNKAETLNLQFGNTAWTPRKIDMVLWAVRVNPSPRRTTASGLGAKDYIRQAVATQGYFSLDEAIAAGYKEVTLKTALSDLKNPRYAGPRGVLVLTPVGDRVWRPL